MHIRLKRAVLGAAFVIVSMSPRGLGPDEGHAAVAGQGRAGNPCHAECRSHGGLAPLRADETVMVRPEIAGRVETIHFREGQKYARANRW